MNIQNGHAEVTETYRKLCTYPEIKSARINTSQEGSVTVESSYSQRCLEKIDTLSFSRTHIVTAENLQLIAKTDPQLTAESLWRIPAPSGKKTAVVRKHCPDKKKSVDEKFFVEIWSSKGFCEKTYNISAAEKHGEVYGDDGAFGSFEWNTAESSLVYVAEKKKPKTCSYFEEQKKSSDPADPGSQYLFTDDWGEMLVKREHPVLCMLDLESGDVTVLEDHLLEDFSCGMVVWCPDDSGLVFSAFHHKPFRLGITHCPIRRSMLYHYDMNTKVYTVLRDDGKCSVRSPKFSPDGSKLIYLECEAGGAHCKSLQLKVIDWQTKEHKVIVDKVYSAPHDAEFQGIYNQGLSARCWSADSSHVFFSTNARSRKDVFSVNVTSGYLRRITSEAGTWTVRDVRDGYILATVTNINRPYKLVIGCLKELNGNGHVSWIILEESETIADIKWEILQHQPRVPNEDYENLVYESIVLRPSNPEKSRGLIVFPHGGPHSMFSCGYQIYFVALVQLGFHIVLVNFRGSTGYGEDSIKSLPNKVGDQDVKDVQQAAEEVVEKYNLNKENVVVLGGSHGGFLAAHLIGQYPGFYKAAVCRNPVTNIASMVALSDIPDWGHVEAGVDSYSAGRVPTGEDYETMRKKSPVAHLDKVITPTMIMLGQDDRRVPPSQGMEFYKALLAKGTKAKLFIYPGNSHPICSIEAESDSFVNLYKWFVEHLATCGGGE